MAQVSTVTSRPRICRSTTISSLRPAFIPPRALEKSIELAIRDDDPTRVMIDCEHKTVMGHPASDPTLVRLGLERANPKIDPMRPLRICARRSFV